MQDEAEKSSSEEACIKSFDGDGNEKTATALRVKQCILAVLQNANVAGEIKFFGSLTNGFDISLSDLDATLVTAVVASRVDIIAILKRLKLTMQRPAFVDQFRDVTTIFEACVPILKFSVVLGPNSTDKIEGKDEEGPTEDTTTDDSATDEGPTDDTCVVEVDLSINNFLGCWNSKLLRTYCDYDVRIAQLGQMIKAWAKNHDLVGTMDGYLNCYAYMLLVIFYLQNGCNPPVAPNLQAAAGPEDARRVHDANGISWSTAFKSDTSDMKGSANTLLVPSLLRGFFIFYTRVFKWDAIAISIREGSLAVLKDTLQCFSSTAHSDPNQWCIEDPFDLRRNIATNCSAAGKKRILTAMQKALEEIDAGNVNAIVDPPPVETKYYYLKCPVYGTAKADEILDFFLPFGIQKLYYPLSTTSKFAFLVFDSRKARRRAQTKNECFVGDLQLQLHYTTENAFADVYSITEYVHHTTDQAKKKDDEKNAEAKKLNPEAAAFIPRSMTRLSTTTPSSFVDVYNFHPPALWEDTSIADQSDNVSHNHVSRVPTNLELAEIFKGPSHTSIEANQELDWLRERATRLEVQLKWYTDYVVNHPESDKFEWDCMMNMIKTSWIESPMRLLPQIQQCIRSSWMLPLRVHGVRRIHGLLTVGNLSSEAYARIVNTLLVADLIPDLVNACCSAKSPTTKDDARRLEETELTSAFISELLASKIYVSKPTADDTASTIEVLRAESLDVIRLLCGNSVGILVGELLPALKLATTNATSYSEGKMASAKICAQVLVALVASKDGLALLWEHDAPSVLLTLLLPKKECPVVLREHFVRILAIMTIHGTGTDRSKMVELGARDAFIHSLSTNLEDAVIVELSLRALVALASVDAQSTRDHADDNQSAFSILIETLHVYSDHQVIAILVLKIMAEIKRDIFVFRKHLSKLLNASLLIMRRNGRPPQQEVVNAASELLRSIAEKCGSLLTEVQCTTMVAVVTDHIKQRKADAEALCVLLQTLTLLCEQNPAGAIGAVVRNKASWCVMDLAMMWNGNIQIEALCTIRSIVEPVSPCDDVADKAAFCERALTLVTKLPHRHLYIVRELAWFILFRVLQHLACPKTHTSSIEQFVEGGLLSYLLVTIRTQMRAADIEDRPSDTSTRRSRIVDTDVRDIGSVELTFVTEAMVALVAVVECGSKTTVCTLAQNEDFVSILCTILSNADGYITTPATKTLAAKTLRPPGTSFTTLASTTSAPAPFAEGGCAVLCALRAMLVLHRACVEDGMDQSAYWDTCGNVALVASVTQLALHGNSAINVPATMLADQMQTQCRTICGHRCPVPWTLFVDLLHPAAPVSLVESFRVHAASCSCTFCCPLTVYLENNPDVFTSATTSLSRSHPRIRHIALQTLQRLLGSKKKMMTSIHSVGSEHLATINRCVALVSSEELLVWQTDEVRLDALSVLVALSECQGVYREVVSDIVSIELAMHALQKAGTAEAAAAVLQVVSAIFKVRANRIEAACASNLLALLGRLFSTDDPRVIREVCNIISIIADHGHFTHIDGIIACELVAPMVESMKVAATKMEAYTALCCLAIHSNNAQIEWLVRFDILRWLIRSVGEMIRSINEVSSDNNGNESSTVPVGADLDKMVSADTRVMVHTMLALCSVLRSGLDTEVKDSGKSKSTNNANNNPYVRVVDAMDGVSQLELLRACASVRVSALAQEALELLSPTPTCAPKPPTPRGKARKRTNVARMTGAEPAAAAYSTMEAPESQKECVVVPLDPTPEAGDGDTLATSRCSIQIVPVGCGLKPDGDDKEKRKSCVFIDRFMPVPGKETCQQQGCDYYVNWLDAAPWMSPDTRGAYCCALCKGNKGHSLYCTKYCARLQGLDPDFTKRPYVHVKGNGLFYCDLCSTACDLSHFRKKYHLHRERGLQPPGSGEGSTFEEQRPPPSPPPGLKPS
eukprot:GEMP01000621.1.p1 GENE.GEMP01000621.1~~GEMP01000621.1.p1  ORF type:complete len:1932 (+),score=476.24 GEMP01000621.1:276-6071(+)